MRPVFFLTLAMAIVGVQKVAMLPGRAKINHSTPVVGQYEGLPGQQVSSTIKESGTDWNKKLLDKVIF